MNVYDFVVTGEEIELIVSVGVALVLNTDAVSCSTLESAAHHCLIMMLYSFPLLYVMLAPIFAGVSSTEYLSTSPA